MRKALSQKRRKQEENELREEEEGGTKELVEVATDEDEILPVGGGALDGLEGAERREEVEYVEEQLGG